MSEWNDRDRTLFALTVGAVLLLAQINWFYVPLVDILTPFLLNPLELALLVFLLVASILWLSSARARNSGRLARIALSVACLCALVAPFVVPTEAIKMKIDFREHRAQREAVAQRVLASPTNDLVKLPWGEKHLSRGGGEVFVDPVGQHRFVLFFYNRGVLDNFSGFLYVPPEANIDEYTRDGTVEATEQLADGWYMVRGL